MVLLKAPSPKVVKFGKDKSSITKLEHYQKAAPPIVVIVSGKLIVVKLEQLLKVLTPKVISVEGRFTLCKLVHDKKVLRIIVVTDPKLAILVILVPVKASSPKVPVALGIDNVPVNPVFLKQ